MTKHEQMQAFVRHYKQQTNKTVVTMAEVARAAIAQGWAVPRPVSGEERLAKEFASAEREELGYDQTTHRPYRANLAISQRMTGGQQLALWVETDDATRSQMTMAMAKYREQMLGEAVIGTNTVDHWNRTHPAQEPLPFPLDFTEETQWRLNAPLEEQDGESA
jgi:hypothetical protein